MHVGFGTLFFLFSQMLSSCSPQSASCGIATPWIRVVNQASQPVKVTAWDGASSLEVAGGTTRLVFPHGAPPAPPWHVVVADLPTGRVLLDRRLEQRESVEEILVKASGTTMKPTTPDVTSRC